MYWSLFLIRLKRSEIQCTNYLFPQTETPNILKHDSNSRVYKDLFRKQL